MAKPTTCPTCGGTGQIGDPTPAGGGFFLASQCDACKGTGRKQHKPHALRGGFSRSKDSERVDDDQPAPR